MCHTLEVYECVLNLNDYDVGTKTKITECPFAVEFSSLVIISRLDGLICIVNSLRHVIYAGIAGVYNLTGNIVIPVSVRYY